MMFRVLFIITFANSNELDRHEYRPLMQQLKDRVLGVRASTSPGDRGRGPADRLALLRHGLAVRFHLELLEIEGQQAQPLVIGEDAAALAGEVLGVESVGEGGNQRNVFSRLGEAEMAIHFGGPFEQFLEGVPAERERRGHADRAP